MAQIHKTESVCHNYQGVFYDSNIWINLYGIYAEGKYNIAKYSHFHKYFLTKNIPIYVNSHSIAEFINVNLWYSHKDYESKNNIKLKPKDYRGTDEFKVDFEKIRLIVEHEILTHSKILNKTFKQEHFIKHLNLMSGGYIDIIDVVFMDMCIDKNILMVTDDRDLILYPSNNFHVLTARRI